MDLMQYGQPTDDFIIQASFDGRLKTNKGTTATAIGDLCTLTAAAGKDLFFIGAKIKGGDNSTAVFELNINGTVVETGRVTGVSNNDTEYTFTSKGHKVAATQVMKVEWITESGAGTYEGFIQAVEVPTGQNPLTYRGA